MLSGSGNGNANELLWDETRISTTPSKESGGLRSIVSLVTTTIISTTTTPSFNDTYGNLFNESVSTWVQLQELMDNSSAVNLSSTEVPYTPYEYRPETYIIPILFAIIFIVGVLGNGTLVIVFLRHRTMRNVPNTYILSLALADLLVIVTTVPLTSTVYTFQSWPYGSLLCTVSEFTKDVSIGVSVFTLTALSGDRFFAIVDPLRKFHIHSGGRRATRMTIATAVSIWILAIICGVPAILGSHLKVMVVNKDMSFCICYPFPDEWGDSYARGIVMARFLIFYAIPLSIITLFYIMIAKHLMYSANHVPGEIQGAVRQVRARRKVAVTVLAFVVIFGLCFFPSHLFMLWFYYSPTSHKDYNDFWHILRMVGFCLSFANSCANPVALYCVSGAFRKHFNRYLLCQGPFTGSRGCCGNFAARENNSLTSTMSRRYPSRRLCNQQTIRSRLQETTITVTMPKGEKLCRPMNVNNQRKPSHPLATNNTEVCLLENGTKE